MRVQLAFVLAAVVGGCGGGNPVAVATTSNGGAPGGGMTGATDGGGTTGDGGGGSGSDGGGGGGGGAGDMGTVDHGPPITNGHVTTYGKGGDFHDVSTDAGGNIWAVTPTAVYYFAGGNVFSYDQGDGLARGQATYTDDYWCIGSTPCPATNPVQFTTVAGGSAGQVFVGNIGYTGDRVDVDPATGAVRDVVGMQVTSTQQSGSEELPEQQKREIASWKAIIDPNGPMNGRAYFGGFHGLSALNGMNAPMSSRLCGQGCPAYEQHVHPFSSDGTQVLGRDIRAIALTSAGDLWVGDADSLWFFPQRSAGAGSDFFQPFGIPGKPGATSLDVFPGVVDYIYGVGVDGAGGLWVASNGNGLAHLSAGSYAATFFTSANGLPQNSLTDLAIDAHGDVWIGTSSAGVARYSPATQAWDYLTVATGLPSNDIRAVRIDAAAGNGSWVWFATDNGVAVYKP